MKVQPAAFLRTTLPLGIDIVGDTIRIAIVPSGCTWRSTTPSIPAVDWIARAYAKVQ